jgi:hypothetical protein
MACRNGAKNSFLARLHKSYAFLAIHLSGQTDDVVCDRTESRVDSREEAAEDVDVAGQAIEVGAVVRMAAPLMYAKYKRHESDLFA